MRTVGDTSVPEQAKTPLSRYATYGCPLPSGCPPVIAGADAGKAPKARQSATTNKSRLIRIPSPLSGRYVQLSFEQCIESSPTLAADQSLRTVVRKRAL